MKRPTTDDPRSVRYKMRRARFKWIERIIDHILLENEKATILDIGGRRDYWKLLAPAYHDRVQITILNLDADVAQENQNDGQNIDISTRVGDGTNMPEIPDQSYDLAHSNSVIEHVGLYKSMAALAAETRRVGKAYYLQTPNFWFPLEPHYGIPFFHWLPEPSRLFLQSSVNVGFAKKTTWEGAMSRVDHTRIVSRRLLRHLFPDAVHENERFAFLNKSLVAYRDYPKGMRLRGMDAPSP